MNNWVHKTTSRTNCVHKKAITQIHQLFIPLFLPSLFPDGRHHGNGCVATWWYRAGGRQRRWQSGDAVQEGTSQQAHHRPHTRPQGRETPVHTVPLSFWYRLHNQFVLPFNISTSFPCQRQVRLKRLSGFKVCWKGKHSLTGQGRKTKKKNKEKMMKVLLTWN